MFGLFSALSAAFAVGWAVFFFIVFFGILYLCCPWWIWLPATIYMGLVILWQMMEEGYIRDTSNDAPPATEIKHNAPVKYDPTQMGKPENYVSFHGPKNLPSSSSKGMNITAGK